MRRNERKKEREKGKGTVVVKAQRNAHVRARQTVVGAREELRTLYQGNIFPSLPVKNYAFYGFRSRM